jgi:hypothetical protein
MLTSLEIGLILAIVVLTSISFTTIKELRLLKMEVKTHHDGLMRSFGCLSGQEVRIARTHVRLTKSVKSIESRLDDVEAVTHPLGK